jgi:hypothetical protein
MLCNLTACHIKYIEYGLNFHVAIVVNDRCRSRFIFMLRQFVESEQWFVIV